MNDARVRHRVQAELFGTGRREPSGGDFDFRVLDFTVAGLRLALGGGDMPAAGERVALHFVPHRLDGFDRPVRVLGTVRRVEPAADGSGAVTCGVALDGVRLPDDGDALDAAYLEHFLMQRD